MLRSDNCAFPDRTLKELATKRLKMREDPMDIPDLTTYINYRKSCWFLEETEDGQFRCDCPIGHKGKVCKHELALNYLHKRIEVLPHAAALPLGTKRPKGRPQKINMDKPKEPGYSAISSTEISSEEGNVPPGRDEVGEDIDGLDLLPLVVDEPALDVGGEVLVRWCLFLRWPHRPQREKWLTILPRRSPQGREEEGDQERLFLFLLNY